MLKYFVMRDIYVGGGVIFAAPNSIMIYLSSWIKLFYLNIFSQ